MLPDSPGEQQWTYLAPLPARVDLHHPPHHPPEQGVAPVQVEGPVGKMRARTPHPGGADHILKSAQIPEGHGVQITVKPPNFEDQGDSQGITHVDCFK